MAPSSEANSVHSTATSGPGEAYKCRHCEKTFRNGQALGGHQNAHRSVHRGVMRRVADAMGSLRNPQQLAAGPSSFESCEVNQVVHRRRKTEPQNPREGKQESSKTGGTKQLPTRIQKEQSPSQLFPRDLFIKEMERK